jgi:predicted RNA-binding protein Jag
MINSPPCTEIAVKRIIDNFDAMFDKYRSWESPSVRNAMDFLDNCVRNCEHFAEATGVSDILLKMAGSDYLFFDDNLLVLSMFFKKVTLRIDAPAARRKVEATLARLKFCKDSVGSSKFWNIIEDILKFADPLGMKPDPGFLPLLVKEVDWTSASVTEYLRKLSKNMKIGASVVVQKDAHNVTEKMATSNYVFLGSNLVVFCFFLVKVGPGLNGDAWSNISWRLTDSLDWLSSKSQYKPHEVREYVEAIRRKMGRPSTLTVASTSLDMDDLCVDMSSSSNNPGLTTSEGERDDSENVLI